MHLRAFWQTQKLCNTVNLRPRQLRCGRPWGYPRNKKHNRLTLGVSSVKGRYYFCAQNQALYKLFKCFKERKCFFKYASLKGVITKVYHDIKSSKISRSSAQRPRTFECKFRIFPFRGDNDEFCRGKTTVLVLKWSGGNASAVGAGK